MIPEIRRSFSPSGGQDTGWEVVMFRNREIRWFAVLFIFITATSAAAGFAIHPAAGILTFVSAAAFGVAFFAL